MDSMRIATTQVPGGFFKRCNERVKITVSHVLPQQILDLEKKIPLVSGPQMLHVWISDDKKPYTT